MEQVRGCCWLSAKLHRFSFAPLLLLLLCGCISTGKRVSVEALQQVRAGTSTIADVERLLGRPSERLEEDGRTMFRYERTQYRPYDGGYGTAGLRQTSVDILFDERGIVSRMHRAETRNIVRGGGFGGMVAGREMTKEQLDAIQPGKTTLAELRRHFGDPFSESLTFDGMVVRIWIFMKQKSAFSETGGFYLRAEFDSNDTLMDTFYGDLGELLTSADE